MQEIPKHPDKRDTVFRLASKLVLNYTGASMLQTNMIAYRIYMIIRKSRYKDKKLPNYQYTYAPKIINGTIGKRIMITTVVAIIYGNNTR
jgi:hypothetical protein